jgi:hypothetical protein
MRRTWRYGLPALANHNQGRSIQSGPQPSTSESLKPSSLLAARQCESRRLANYFDCEIWKRLIEGRAGQTLIHPGSRENNCMPTGRNLTNAEVSEILNLILTRPDLTHKAIAELLGLHPATIRLVSAQHNIHRKRGRKAEPMPTEVGRG